MIRCVHVGITTRTDAHERVEAAGSDTVINGKRLIDRALRTDPSQVVTTIRHTRAPGEVNAPVNVFPRRVGSVVFEGLKSVVSTESDSRTLNE